MSDGEIKGRLFIVATPIGNLEDITLRAVNVLKAVPIVAAEDTRRSRHLLTHLGASPERILSLHDHNESARTDMIVEILQSGSDVALAERSDGLLGKGEFVCVVPRADDASADLGPAARRLMQVLCEELPPAQAARLAAKATRVQRAELYDYAMRLRQGASVD